MDRIQCQSSWITVHPFRVFIQHLLCASTVPVPGTHQCIRQKFPPVGSSQEDGGEQGTKNTKTLK